MSRRKDERRRSNRRDRVSAAAASLVVVVVLAFGFHRLGPHQRQRLFRADEQRVRDLQSIARALYVRHKPLPLSLAEIPAATFLHTTDPVTRALYEYHRQSDTSYDVCATFETDSAADENQPSFWSHAAGRHCFAINATQPVPY